MSRATHRDAVIQIAIVIAGAAAAIVLGERIGVHHGTGWDGEAYAAWAHDFPRTVLDGHINAYQSLRVLPSAIIYYLGGGADPVAGFQFLDAAALTISAALLARIALVMSWPRTTSWAAFIATFGSFALAKHALYNPVLTDTSAFALGMATVWAFVERRPIAQWLVALLSMFTWPALAPIGFALLLMPRPRAWRLGERARIERWLPWIIAVLAAGFVVAWLYEEILHPFPGTEVWLARSRDDLWPVTIGVSALWVAAAAGFVARAPETWRIAPYLRDVGVVRLAISAIACGAIVAARFLWIDRIANEPGIDFVAMQHLVAAHSLRAPAWNLVHHVVYFGPVVLLAIVAWPRIAAMVATWGPGAVLSLGMAIVVAMTTESRLLHHAMPLVIVLVFEATATVWTRARVAVLAVVAIAWSKLWLVIGYDTPHDAFAWPDLRYTMNQGPWASMDTFIAHAIAAVVTGAVLALAVRQPADARS